MSKTKDKVISGLNNLREREREANHKKVMLRINHYTYVLVHPKNNTPEYVDKVRQRFESKPKRLGGYKKST